jgi:hypothetical protein
MCVDYDAVGTGSEEAATNGKILALTTKLADVIVLSLWSSDVGRNVPYNTLALQVGWAGRRERGREGMNGGASIFTLYLRVSALVCLSFFDTASLPSLSPSLPPSP